MKRPKNLVIEPELVNIHQVRGELVGIEYLKVADTNVVEGLFLRSKMKGRAEFKFRGFHFVLIHNKDLTYTVEEKIERASLVDSLT